MNWEHASYFVIIIINKSSGKASSYWFGTNILLRPVLNSTCTMFAVYREFLRWELLQTSLYIYISQHLKNIYKPIHIIVWQIIPFKTTLSRILNGKSIWIQIQSTVFTQQRVHTKLWNRCYLFILTLSQH